MFGLERTHIEFILNILNNNIQDSSAKYYVFGSRTKDTYKEYSDIDIAIDCNGNKIPYDIMSKISIDFNDSTFPYEVDVIDLNNITEKFKNLISDSLVELK